MTRQEQIAAWVRLTLRVLPVEYPELVVTFDVLHDNLETMAERAGWNDWRLSATEVDAAARPYEHGEPGRYTYALPAHTGEV